MNHDSGSSSLHRLHPSPSLPDARAQAVLDFWFGAPGSPEYGQPRDFWFKKSAATDRHVRAQFSELHAQALAGRCDAWVATPLGACALIIVLDQFSRHLFRGEAAAFAADAQALGIAASVVHAGVDRQLPTPMHRSFVYMPFEHDESEASQRVSLKLFGALRQETGLTEPLEWAEKHAEVIARFGRYPHRNAVLGRESSAAESAFLLQSGSRF
jgi:uncharacterized protein (DUF924 family)